jgi:hypothetical protein
MPFDNTDINPFTVIYTANDGSGQRQLSAFQDTQKRDLFTSYLKNTLGGNPPDGTTTDWWVLSNSDAIGIAHSEVTALGGTSYSIQSECSKKVSSP